jgi:hypothetical protein
MHRTYGCADPITRFKSFDTRASSNYSTCTIRNRNDGKFHGKWILILLRFVVKRQNNLPNVLKQTHIYDSDIPIVQRYSFNSDQTVMVPQRRYRNGFLIAEVVDSILTDHRPL